MLLSGLAQTGSWACLDELHRIAPPVLSVLAQMLRHFLNSLRSGRGDFEFGGSVIALKPSVAVFATFLDRENGARVTGEPTRAKSRRALAIAVTIQVSR